MQMWFRLLFLLALPAFAAPPATETRLTFKVVSVHDGDTVTGINESNEQVKVRPAAVDARRRSLVAHASPQTGLVTSTSVPLGHNSKVGNMS